MFDIITLGSATQDIIVKPKKLTNLKYEKKSTQNEVCFPFGSKINVDQILFTSGGGGTNTAVTFALQGFKTAFCGVVGDDAAGKKIIAELKSLKIKTTFIQITKEKPTNHSVIISSDGTDRTIFAYRGASELIDEIPFKKLKTKWLYLAPLTGYFCAALNRTATPDSSYAATLFSDIIYFAAEHNIPIAVNPGIAQLSLPNFAQIAQKIHVLFLNQEEASFLTKIPYNQEKEIFQKLNQLCPGITVMTKGGAGVVVSDGKTIYSALPPQNRIIVDTTGAGDAFASGFMAKFMGSYDIESSIQLGMANSVANLTQVGAKTGLLKKGQEFEKVEVKKENINN